MKNKSNPERDAARLAYNALPTTASPEEFAAGHGNWSLTEDEFKEAVRLTRIVVPGSFPVK